LTDAIIVGQMAATPADQTLRINAATLIQPDGGAVIPLTLKANASQTANILEIQKSDGTLWSGADSAGRLFCHLGTDTSNFFAGLASGNPTNTGNGNVAIGDRALASITDATNCFALGKLALNENQSGDGCVAIGIQSLQANKGSGNIGIGYESGLYSENGINNVFIGSGSGRGVSEQSQNYTTAIGYRSGNKLTSSEYCTFIGGYAGYAVTSGDACVFIGYGAGFKQTTASNLLIIDNQGRASAAAELTDCILYGVMAAAPADQTLRINADLTTTGGRTRNTTVVAADTYDLTVNDDILHVTYTSTAAVTSLTLPTAQVVDGRTIVIKDAGGEAATNNITIDTEGSETIDGRAIYTMNNDYESITIYSDGSNWYVI